MTDSRNKENCYVLNGFWGNWRLSPSPRRVELSLLPSRQEYCFRFFAENQPEPIIAQGNLRHLQFGIEHFVWLAEAFLCIRETSAYRTGRFANKVCFRLEIEPLILVLSPLSPAPECKRARCEFWIKSSGDTVEDEGYIRFEMFVLVEEAEAFGRALLEGLAWQEYPVP